MCSLSAHHENRTAEDVFIRGIVYAVIRRHKCWVTLFVYFFPHLWDYFIYYVLLLFIVLLPVLPSCHHAVLLKWYRWWKKWKYNSVPMVKDSDGFVMVWGAYFPGRAHSNSQAGLMFIITTGTKRSSPCWNVASLQSDAIKNDDSSVHKFCGGLCPHSRSGCTVVWGARRWHANVMAFSLTRSEHLWDILDRHLRHFPPPLHIAWTDWRHMKVWCHVLSAEFQMPLDSWPGRGDHQAKAVHSQHATWPSYSPESHLQQMLLIEGLQ